ncbi:MAG: hypothetical protein WBK77_05820 [Alphaproteobacteria bacterium]
MSLTPTPQLILNPAIPVIPPAKSLFAIRFQRIEQFRIEILARNANEAFAEAVNKFQTDEGRAQRLISMLDYFTAENLTKARGE